MVKYDLKGAADLSGLKRAITSNIKYPRHVRGVDGGVTGEYQEGVGLGLDGNFETVHPKGIELQTADWQHLLRTMVRDTKLLESKGIVDQSVFPVIFPKPSEEVAGQLKVHGAIAGNDKQTGKGRAALSNMICLCRSPTNQNHHNQPTQNQPNQA
jgi:hypothetical protein